MPLTFCLASLLHGVKTFAFPNVFGKDWEAKKVDEFMKEYVVGLDVSDEGDVFLRIRKNEIKVLFGKSEEIETKFQKFKAFYKLTKKDSLLDNYSLINLKFKDQVVATKKETNGG